MSSRQRFLAILLLGLITPSLGAQDAVPEAVPSEQPGELEPWQLEQILDKPAIAEETYQRLYGLEEAGNPHLKRGTILEHAQLAPVDEYSTEVRRERALRTFASRTIDWSAPAEHESGNQGVTPPAVQKISTPPGSSWTWRITTLTLAALFFWRLKRRS